MLRNVPKYLRTNDWLDSKVPFMLAVVMFFCMEQPDMTASRLYCIFGAFFLYTSMFLAFSYVINDFTDMDVDMKAGKQKVMYNLKKSTIIISMIAVIIIGITPMALIVGRKILYCLFTLFLYIAGSAYSVPFLFRFKERGIIGLIECSVAQRCLPLVAILFVVPVNWIYFTVFMILSFVNGLRYILIHQAIDLENDIKSGVHTFVSDGHNRFKIGIIVTFAIECALFIGLFVMIGIEHWYAPLLLIPYLALEVVITLVITKYMRKDVFISFLAVPLEALYNVFFPVILAFILTLENIACLGLIIFLILLTCKSMRGKLAFVSVYLKAKLKINQTNK